MNVKRTALDERIGSVWYIHFELAISTTTHSHRMGPFTAVEGIEFVTEARDKTAIAVG
jgi:hypothetical protein